MGSLGLRVRVKGLGNRLAVEGPRVQWTMNLFFRMKPSQITGTNLHDRPFSRWAGGCFDVPA